MLARVDSGVSFWAGHLETLFRYKRLIMSVTVFTTLATLITILLVPRVYQAESSLLVKLGREYLYVPEMGREMSYTPTRLEEMINAETQILMSDNLHRDVIEEVGLAQLFPDLVEKPDAMAKGLREFNEHLTIKTIADAHVVYVYFRHINPELAARVVNLLVDKFKELRASIYGSVDAEFLEGLVKASEKRLREAEADLAAFMEKNGFVSFNDQKQLAMQQINRIDETLNNNKTRVAGLEQKRASLALELANVPQTVVAQSESRNSSAIDNTKQKLLELRLREQQLLTQFREDSRTVESLRKEIAQVEKFLAGQEAALTDTVRTERNPIYESLEASLVDIGSEIEQLQAESARLRGQRRDAEKSLGVFSKAEIAYAEKQRIVDAYRRDHESQFAKLNEARMSDSLDQGKQTNVRVIQRADVPEIAIGLSKKARLILGAVFGFFLGIGLALLASRFRPSVGDVLQTEQRLQVPVLALLPAR